MPEVVQPGTLYIISTPIGNLEDISSRAVRVLSSVDIIAAEDTRTTGILLNHYSIRKPLVSYFSYNEIRRTPEFIEKLRSGLSIGLVTDAGTPGISDPAFMIVRSAIEAGFPIIAIPGPTAFLPALIVSGLSMERFAFEGFLPAKKGRKTKLESLRSEVATIVLYESPHRIVRTLKDLSDHLGPRRASVSRELTKKFEETVRGTLPELAEHFSKRQQRGEFTVVVAGRRTT